MEKKTASKAAAKKRPAPRRPAGRKLSKPAPPKQKTRRVYRRLTNEFKPDAPLVSAWKPMQFTDLQRKQVLRWGLYFGMCLLCLLLQDCVMSQFSLLNATTDLPAAVLLTIAVLEGSDTGSVFILCASVVYYFSGSAPGPYSVGLLSILGLFATVLRQRYLNRSTGSIVLCSALAVMAYELSLYIVGLFLGLTYWTRLPVFFLTGLLTILTVWPLYRILYRIGLIGGNIWKE